MSDESDEKNGRAKGKGGFERPPVPPSPRDQQFFEWLERLFYSEPEPSHFPEKIELRVMTGPKKDRYGQLLETIPFAPKNSSKAAQDAGAGRGKPTREELAHLSNRLLSIMQRNCDEFRRTTMFGVAVWHLSVSDEPYQCWFKRCAPMKKFGSDDAEEEANEENDERRWSSQVLRHNENMFGLYAAGFEGIVDRQDRIVERVIRRNDQLEARIEKLVDALERALSLESERQRAAKWDELKIDAAKQGLGMTLQLAPPLLNQLTGKQVIPTQDTPETITLKNFLRTKDEGGSLTQEQAEAAFGVYGPPPELKLLKPGILSQAQAEIIFGVAHCKLSPDDLDKLIPGGPAPQLAIAPEQLMALQAVIPIEQLMPLQIVFQSRYQKLNQPKS